MKKKNHPQFFSRLSDKRKEQIRELEACCNTYDGTHSEAYLDNDLNFRRSFKGFGLCYEGEELIGFLNLSVTDYPTAEARAYVRPDRRRQGVFTELLRAAEDELDAWGIEELLYVIASESKDGTAAARHMGLEHRYSEQLMRLDMAAYEQYVREYKRKQPSRVEQDEAQDLDRCGRQETMLDLDNCGQQDAGQKIRIGMTPCRENVQLRRVHDNTDETVEIYELYACNSNLADSDRDRNDCVLGQACVSIGTRTDCIFDVFIGETLRGRGYGSELVRLLLEELNARENRHDIVLEVTSVNIPACRIYEKAGFRVTEKIGYFV